MSGSTWVKDICDNLHRGYLVCCNASVNFKSAAHPPPLQALEGYLTFSSSSQTAPRWTTEVDFLVNKSTDAYFSWQMLHPTNC